MRCSLVHQSLNQTPAQRGRVIHNMKLYQAIAAQISRRENSAARDNFENERDACDRITEYEKELPRGSGIDSGSKILLAESSPNKIVIQADFHHMDENGFYCGWTEHKIIIRPCLRFGFDLKVTGRDKDGIKDYLADLYHHDMGREIANV